MRRIMFLLFALPAASSAAEHDHATNIPAAVEHDHAAQAQTLPEHDHAAGAQTSPEHDPAAQTQTPPEHDHAEQAQTAVAAADEDVHEHLMFEHGGSLNFLVLGERFEQSDADTRAWEAQGWLGYDYDKLWLKTEGEYDTEADATEHSEVQALYSHAVAPYWDMQAGLRRDDAGSESRTYAVLGLMGLAPYWFEVDAATFVSEHGDLSARLEVEYELRFTQRLFLQPRLELNYNLDDDFAMNIGKGVSEASFGLRLRYEWRREIAPYAGIEWVHSYGNTAALRRAAGVDDGDTRIVAGLRFWY